MERDFVTLTSFLDPHAVITAQPITISFKVGGAARRYTPDYSVTWSDGRREIVEVKYQSDLRANQERFKERFAAIEDGLARAGRLPGRNRAGDSRLCTRKRQAVTAAADGRL